MAGLKAGPETAARPEAGNREEGLACLFRVCAILPHQACADGSVFFRRRLPKAGLSESVWHIRLVLDPSPRSDLHCSTCGSFSPTYANVRGFALGASFSSAAPGSCGYSVHLLSKQTGGDPGAGARMSRVAASAVSARMSNMKRIPAHGGWLLARKKECPMCGHTMIDIQACHDLCPNCGAHLDCSDGP